MKKLRQLVHLFLMASFPILSLGQEYEIAPNNGNLESSTIMKKDASGNYAYIATQVNSGSRIRAVFSKLNLRYGNIVWSFAIDDGSSSADFIVKDIDVDVRSGTEEIFAVGHIENNGSFNQQGFLLVFNSNGVVLDFENLNIDGADVTLLDCKIFNDATHTEAYYAAGKIDDKGFICSFNSSMDIIHPQEVKPNTSGSHSISITEILEKSSSGTDEFIYFFGNAEPTSTAYESQIFDGKMEYSGAVLSTTFKNYKTQSDLVINDAFIDVGNNIKILAFSWNPHGPLIFNRNMSNPANLYTFHSTIDKTLYDLFPSRFYKGDEWITSQESSEPRIVVNGKLDGGSGNQVFTTAQKSSGLNSYTRTDGSSSALVSPTSQPQFDESSLFYQNVNSPDELYQLNHSLANNTLYVFKENIKDSYLTSCSITDLFTDDSFTELISNPLPQIAFSAVLQPTSTGNLVARTFSDVLTMRPTGCSNIIHVDENVPVGNPQDGRSWATAFDDLQTALASISPTPPANYEIWVSEGTYIPHNSDRQIAFELIDGLKIYGGFSTTNGKLAFEDRDAQAYKTRLSGDIQGDGIVTNNSYVIIKNENNGVTTATLLDGFYIEESYSEEVTTWHNAGALWNKNTSMTVENCVFFNNHSDNPGGGILLDNSNSIIKDCVFEDNNTTFENQGTSGGAIDMIYSNPHIENCIFKGNWTDNYGGAMGINAGSGPTVINCLFYDNEAFYGGAIWLAHDCPARFYNCTIIENHATKNTFPGSTAEGGAIVDFSGFNGNPPKFYNCIIYNNTSSGTRPNIWVFNLPTRAEFRYCDIEGSSPWVFDLGEDKGGNIPDPPLFVNAGSDDFRLKDRAGVNPVIDKGNHLYLPAGIKEDLIGHDRNQGSNIDMGCYEADPNNPLFRLIGSFSKQDSINTDQVLVYPNPTRTSILISGLEENESARIRIFNSEGKLITDQKVSGMNLSIDLSRYKNGLYLVSIEQGELISRKRILKID